MSIFVNVTFPTAQPIQQNNKKYFADKFVYSIYTCFSSMFNSKSSEISKIFTEWEKNFLGKMSEWYIGKKPFSPAQQKIILKILSERSEKIKELNVPEFSSIIDYVIEQAVFSNGTYYPVEKNEIVYAGNSSVVIRYKQNSKFNNKSLAGLCERNFEDIYEELVNYSTTQNMSKRYLQYCPNFGVWLLQLNPITAYNLLIVLSGDCGINFHANDDTMNAIKDALDTKVVADFKYDENTGKIVASVKNSEILSEWLLMNGGKLI